MEAPDSHDPRFEKLLTYLARIPALDINDTPSRGFGSGEASGRWWVKFSIDIDHELAWETVQELGHVLNYLSLEEQQASSFKPVSPPPYLNGGPEEFLSWMIEAPDALAPGSLADLLEERLPTPVEDESAWYGESEGVDEDEGDEDEDEGEDSDEADAGDTDERN
ncbi:MAG: hypothetical protein SGJ21_05380 [Alphaproteobacteria bacterium]|nr:hypothetical protein [Alphaproteobacteria bacterium]